MDTTPTRTILLLGATGQVGHELRRTLDPLGAIRAPDRSAVNLTDPDALRRTVDEVSPALIVNAAAYTDVDGAEDEPEAAAAINAHAPQVLAEAAQSVGGWLVHYSTDYVFDGTKTTPYREADPPNPVNVYGRTKRKGETAIQDVGGRFLILRTSWVYSRRRSNFLRTMLRLAEDRDRLTVVDDQIGTPTWAGWIADATASLLRRLFDTQDAGSLSGLYHLAAGGQTSWYGFARAIFTRFGVDDVTVDPVSSDKYPTTAQRPAYTALASARARNTFDLDIPSWTEQLAALQRRVEDNDELRKQRS